MQIAFTWAPPFNFVFDTRPIEAMDALVAVLACVAMLVIGETEKMIRRALL